MARRTAPQESARRKDRNHLERLDRIDAEVRQLLEEIQDQNWESLRLLTREKFATTG